MTDETKPRRGRPRKDTTAPAPTKSKAQTGAKRMDDESQAMLYEGVTLSQIARLFKRDTREVSSKINAKLKPTGERMGFPIYSLAEAASLVALPSEDQVMNAIKNMPANRLPVRLQKEFWDANRSRQKFEQDAGDLWTTDDVVEVFMEVFKTIRTSTNLFADAVDREVALTSEQRSVVISLADDLLADIRRGLLENPKFDEKTNYLDRWKQENEGDLDEEMDAMIQGKMEEASESDG